MIKYEIPATRKCILGGGIFPWYYPKFRSKKCYQQNIDTKGTEQWIEIENAACPVDKTEQTA